MNATQMLTKTAETFSNFALQSLLLSTCLIAAAQVQADSFTLTESQKDIVKCTVVRDPDTHVGYQECSQNTTGSYSVTAKLSANTFIDNGINFGMIDPNTLFGINIGEFTFSSSLSEANKSSLKANSLQGTWIQSHEGCAKYDANGDCTKPKSVTDGTAKLSANFHGATITLSGKSDVDGNGQTIYSRYCASGDPGTTVLNEGALITIGEINITLPIKITCKVTPTTKDPDGLKGGPFDLINMTIKAKLAPTIQ